MDIRHLIDLISASSNTQIITERSSFGSAWVLISCPDTGSVLLAKRAKKSNNPGQWNLFGGGIENGENATATALRELREEAGIEIDHSALRFKGVHNGMNFFVVSMNQAALSAAIKPNRKEVAKVKWFSLGNLPDNLHKSTKMFIKVCTKQSIIGESIEETIELIEFENELKKGKKSF